jgi:mannose-6-phosphate isomerase-like protein (cupin superfamily)
MVWIFCGIFVAERASIGATPILCLENGSNVNLTTQPGGTMLNPIYIAPDETSVIPLFPGITVEIKLRHTQTADLFTSVDVVVAPKTMGPAPHLHDTLDEIMFVVEGEASVLVGDEVTVVKTGGWHLRPHGIVHTFWNAGDKPLRFIDIYPNQNFEDFFPELSALLGEMMSKRVAPTSVEFLQRMRTLDVKWGMTAYYDQRQPLVEKYGLQ